MSESRIESAAIASAITRFRERRPRVHCITNSAAVNFTANVLLAAGAIPSMTVNPEEVPDFVASADALLVNLGTLDPLRREAIDAAVDVAKEAAKPWALDPVFVDRSRPRLVLAKSLAGLEPTVIRCNAAELAALAPGAAQEGGDDAAAEAFALATLCVVACTGEVDFITDGARSARVSGGHPFMSQVTAMGCAATAVLAGLLVVEPDAVVATAACLAFIAIAAEAAGAGATGPGSFVPAFLDAIYALTPEDVGARARIS